MSPSFPLGSGQLYFAQQAERHECHADRSGGEQQRVEPRSLRQLRRRYVGLIVVAIAHRRASCHSPWARGSFTSLSRPSVTSAVPIDPAANSSACSLSRFDGLDAGDWRSWSLCWFIVCLLVDARSASFDGLITLGLLEVHGHGWKPRGDQEQRAALAALAGADLVEAVGYGIGETGRAYV